MGLTFLFTSVVTYGIWRALFLRITAGIRQFLRGEAARFVDASTGQFNARLLAEIADLRRGWHGVAAGSTLAMLVPLTHYFNWLYARWFPLSSEELKFGVVSGVLGVLGGLAITALNQSFRRALLRRMDRTDEPTPILLRA